VAHGLFQKMSGVKGEVKITALGIHLGTMSQWSLVLRGGEDDADGGNGLYDLRAVFSYLNLHLWEDEDYDKDVVITLGKKRQFRVQGHGGETVLAGRTLLMKGVSLHDIEER
jgi:hypothetical protein